MAENEKIKVLKIFKSEEDSHLKPDDQNKQKSNINFDVLAFDSE
eukprot:CAMPEP_0196819548 /NCGR_PEP_ID=MMETSP1362-20130617/71079_1 /TAXON_ID=163516 /ORGANISM="Leptocylindrus danicus, Strain CCMP1856" /LENGTH=43 /DNA_ID= /DNA_START= /DNA_END= /DNA_ORIENTATION=